MRTEQSEFFESKVRREAVAENGTPCKINELCVVKAVSFTDCEARVTENYAPMGEFMVLTEVRAPYGEILFSDKEDEGIYYRCKVAFIYIDDSGKTKKNKVVYLVQGKSIESAKKNLDEVLSQGAADYVVEGIHETVVADILC